MHLNHFNLRPLLTCFLPVWFYVITRYLLPRKEVAQRTTSSELIYPLIRTNGKGQLAPQSAKGEPLVWDFYPPKVTSSASDVGSVVPEALSLLLLRPARKRPRRLGPKPMLEGTLRPGPIPPSDSGQKNIPAKMQNAGGSVAGGAGDVDAVEEIQRRMSWTSKFGDISTEYIFVAVNEQKQPGAAISVSGNGRKKFVQAEGAKEKQKQAEAEGLEPHPEADMTTTVEEDHAADRCACFYSRSRVSRCTD